MASVAGPTPGRAYLDYAATAPPLPVALEATAAAMRVAGNPSGAHSASRAARRILEESRERLAEHLVADPTDVLLTSGGTEADNLAVKGLYWARNAGPRRRPRILVSAIEHDAVLAAARWLASSQGAIVELLAVGPDGRLDTDAAAARIAADPDSVALIAVMAVNNEVGTVQPLGHVQAMAHRHGIPVHCDAVQAVAHLPINFESSGVATMAVTAHKLGGPVGAGALLVGGGEQIVPLLHGGGQERGIRSGTLNAAGAAGLSIAVQQACLSRPDTAAAVHALRSRFVAGVTKSLPDARVNGSTGQQSVSGILSLTVPGCRGEDVVMMLDQAGVDCSAGSACATGVAEPSHVLLAMGLSDADADGSIRFSFGAATQAAEIDRAVAALPDAVAKARAAREVVARGRSH